MSMDATFGTNGVVTTPLTATGPQTVAIQPDGKIVILGGDASGDADLTRLNPDGTSDASFGVNRITKVMLGIITNLPESMLLQADGKILVGLTTQMPNAVPSGGTIFRFNANGTPDTSFGDNGRVAALSGEIDALAQQADGEIVVAGTRLDNPVSPTAVLARFKADGSVDTTFGQNGQAALSTSASESISISRLLVTPDQKALVSGVVTYANTYPYTYASYVDRFNSDGTVDTRFDGSGIAPPGSAFTQIQDMAALPDGTLLFLKFDTSVVTLTRLNYDGSLDNAFGSGGSAADIGGATFMVGPYKLAVRPTGEIVVEGLGSDAVYSGHFTPDGKLLQSETTPTWGQPNPRISWPADKPTPTLMPARYIFGGQLDADGKLVAAGSGYAVRLNPDGYVWAGDPSFHWAPHQWTGSPPPANPARQSAPDPTLAPTPELMPLALRALVQADRAAIESAKLQGNENLAALLAQLHRDQAALIESQSSAIYSTALASARSQAGASVDSRTARAVLQEDRIAIRAARHQRAVTLAADWRKLHADQRIARRFAALADQQD